MQPRVLITTYHQAFLKKGGGETQLIEVASQLRKLGLLADIYGHNSKDLDEYNVVLHFSVHGGAEGLLKEIKKAGKKIAIWPNIWFDRPESYPVDLIGSELELADLILPNSRVEMEQLAKYFKIPANRFTVVPIGVDPCFGEPADPHIFKIIYQVEDYVLTVGIIEERKNQLQLIRALRDGNKPLVLVGNYRDKRYYDQCRKEAPPTFKFVPFLSPKSEALRSAYQNCSVYIEIPDEPAGQSALEAALAGANLVLADEKWAREYFGEWASFVDPKSAESIRTGVRNALQNPVQPKLKEMVVQKFLYPGVLQPLVDTLTKLAHLQS